MATVELVSHRLSHRLSLAHRLWRLIPARARRWALGQTTALLAPRPDQPPPPLAHGVAVGGELGRASGLGEGARLMLAALDALHVPHWSLAAGLTVNGEGDTAPAAAPLPPVGVPLIMHVNAPQMAASLLRLPRDLVRGRRIIGYWAWELPVVPADWRHGLKFVHDVWAPSQFTADALEPLVGRPVRVVPHPVAVRPPVPSALDRQAWGLPADAVITLVSFSLASSFERKNPLAAIAAHRAAFGDRTDRILVLKLANTAHYQADLHRLQAAIAGAANIRLMTDTLPVADSYALIKASDIVLSLHRSEGFGLVPAEAMLLGRPVVATGWSGNMQFMDADSAALVGFDLIAARDPRGVFQAKGAQWADPHISDAANRLRHLADHPDNRAALGARGCTAATARLGTRALDDALQALGLTSGVDTADAIADLALGA